MQAIAFGAVGAACGSDDLPGVPRIGTAQGKVIYATWGAPGLREAEHWTLLSFEKNYTDLKVDVVIASDDPATYTERLRAMVASGTDPDVMRLPGPDAPSFYASAVTRKLDAVMRRDGFRTDVLALKDSDCGIAMASGSEATRGVAQLVLLDSNFSALPRVVAEGRRVINNIERVASLFLAKTVYSIVLSLLTGVVALAYPLQPIHLTIISWLTIGTPAFFLALEPNDQRVQEGFLRRVLGRAVPAGVVIAAATMGVFALVQLDDGIDATHAKTIAVMVAGGVALINLARTAMPWNPLRIAIVATMSTLFVLAFLFPRSRDLFELPVTEWWAYLLGAAFIALAFPLLVLGSRFSERYHRRED